MNVQEVDCITRKEFIEILFAVITILITIGSAIFSLIVKIAVDKAKIEAMERDKILDENINEVKTNYLDRFDGLKNDIADLKLMIERRLNELEIKILKNKNN